MTPALAAAACIAVYFVGYRFYSKFLAEKVFHLVEKGFALVKRLVTEGPAALWDEAKKNLANLKEIVPDYNDQGYDVATFATENLLHEWWGVKPWDRLAVVWGDDREDSDVPLRARLHDHLLGRIHLNAFQVDDAKLAEFAKRLRKFRPVIVQGYATALELLADCRS